MDSVVIRICAIYRPSYEWEHEEYYLTAQIYHGTKKIGKAQLTQATKRIDRDKYWPARVNFDNW